jgi:hypothetical protein
MGRLKSLFPALSTFFVIAGCAAFVVMQPPSVEPLACCRNTPARFKTGPSLNDAVRYMSAQYGTKPDDAFEPSDH